MDDEKKEKSLNNSTIFFMVSVALFYDVLQWFLAFVLMGWAVIPIAYLHFALWFKLHGLKFFTGKRAGWLGAGALLEFVSMGIIPSITFNVLLSALDYKIKKIAPGLDIMNKK